MSDPQLPQCSREYSPAEYSPLAQTPVQWTLAMIAAAWMLSMWLGVGWLGGGMSSPQRDAAESSGSATLLRIDVNVADERELSLLPGVGPVLARRIVSNRERQGQFGSVDELQRVHGVGPKTIERLGEVCEANR